ncbi:hypothetical protein M440DRAFT_247446 [Trichoderma longibrachiatum ATCC 18648]|uniref:Uncharacterized protein n=1 Tax=Trichoderma longibrachiatum ATCC 18648 TaxID=983965 RepID=A0A2T4CDZ0_TRILO|nr:hypothetical protein M440DRAFT_247446 [Trichoderma longibrachiatum ATCC 18648]
MLHIHKFRSGATLSNGPFGDFLDHEPPPPPPATFDSRLIPTNGLARCPGSKVHSCLPCIHTAAPIGVRLPRLSVRTGTKSVRYRPQPRPADWKLPLLASFASWGCFGVSTLFLPFTWLDPASSSLQPCPLLETLFVLWAVVA